VRWPLGKGKGFLSVAVWWCRQNNAPDWPISRISELIEKYNLDDPVVLREYVPPSKCRLQGGGQGSPGYEQGKG
jgi:hypothetical protein